MKGGLTPMFKEQLLQTFLQQDQLMIVLVDTDWLDVQQDYVLVDEIDPRAMCCEAIGLEITGVEGGALHAAPVEFRPIREPDAVLVYSAATLTVVGISPSIPLPPDWAPGKPLEVRWSDQGVFAL